MPIPDFQTVFLPYLQLLSDGQPHSTADAEAYLADYFHLTEDEKRELLPSGKQARFRNRVAWTASHFKQARVIEPVRRGVYKITDRGLTLLKEKPERLNVQSLLRFPEFQEFRARSSASREEEVEEAVAQTHTPEEILEGTYQTLRSNLANDVLERVRQSSPEFFEQLVVDLLVAMGYGGSRSEAGTRIGRSGDGGIDGIIKEDKLGLDAIYIQAKRWEATVGRPVVQAFAGSLEGARARKGVLITTSQFSSDALDYVTRIEKKIVLIGGEELSNLMIDHNVGIAEAQRYVIKKVDLDYFAED